MRAVSPAAATRASPRRQRVPSRGAALPASATRSSSTRSITKRIRSSGLPAASRSASQRPTRACLAPWWSPALRTSLRVVAGRCSPASVLKGQKAGVGWTRTIPIESALRIQPGEAQAMPQALETAGLSVAKEASASTKKLRISRWKDCGELEHAQRDSLFHRLCTLLDRVFPRSEETKKLL